MTDATGPGQKNNSNLCCPSLDNQHRPERGGRKEKRTEDQTENEFCLAVAIDALAERKWSGKTPSVKVLPNFLCIRGYVCVRFYSHSYTLNNVPQHTGYAKRTVKGQSFRGNAFWGLHSQDAADAKLPPKHRMLMLGGGRASVRAITQHKGWFRAFGEALASNSTSGSAHSRDEHHPSAAERKYAGRVQQLQDGWLYSARYRNLSHMCVCIVGPVRAPHGTLNIKL